MRALTYVVALTACARSTPVAKPAECPVAAAPAPAAVAPVSSAPPAAVALDEAAVIEKSEAFLAAVDNADVGGFQAAVAPAFATFVFGRTTSADNYAKALAGQVSTNAAKRSRTCKEQRVRTDASIAVYTARCTVKVPARADMPAFESDSLSNIVLVPVAGTWKVANWVYQPASTDASKEYWNDTYQTGVHFKLEPNQFLVETLKGLKPGKAIDIAMGQGRNALYIASQGWKTTGIDISDEGIKIAKATAAKRKLELDAVVADDTSYDFGKAKWDLVTMLYAGTSHDVIEHVKPSIKKGGLFVVEFFSKDATAGSGIGGFTSGELAQLFSGPEWTIVKDEVVEDVSDWGLVKTKLVRFIAKRAK